MNERMEANYDLGGGGGGGAEGAFYSYHAGGRVGVETVSENRIKDYQNFLSHAPL